MTMPKMLRRRAQRGITLIELIVVVSVLAILAALTAPSFNDFLGRESVKGTATELTSDLQFARSESVQRNMTMTVTFSASGYSIAQGSNPAIKTVTFTGGSSIDSTGATLVATFDPVRGTATLNLDPAAVVISNTRTSGTLRVALNVMGRPSICSPSGAIKGYPTCT